MNRMLKHEQFEIKSCICSLARLARTDKVEINFLILQPAHSKPV